MRKLVTIDCDYLYPQFAAAYLMIENGRAAFIDNNTAYAVPKLLAALKEEAIAPESVDYLIVTHVHLDHAGGTSALLKHCPGAKVIAHPKAARTLINPQRLVASAKKVYGEKEFLALYGEIDAIPEDRVRAMEDGETIQFGDRTLRFFHTKGHATHHFCIHDSGTDGVFTGDSFGLRYPALQSHGLFIFPSTSPVDFDPPEAFATLEKITATGAKRVYLTHFGEVSEIREARDQLREHLHAHARALEHAVASPKPDDALAAECLTELRLHFASYFAKRGWKVGDAEWKLIELDLKLNADGIAYVALQRRNPG